MLVTPDSVPPLDASPLKAYSEPTSENWLMWLPPIGWLWNHMRWQRWAGPIRSRREATLRGRQEIPLETWGDDAHQSVATRILAIIDDDFGWPNTRFVPWDPVCVAMWAYEDGLDDMAAISDIEKAFGVTFTDDEWLRMYGGTLAELIDVLLLKAVR
jgi:hypothetical protein